MRPVGVIAALVGLAVPVPASSHEIPLNTIEGLMSNCSLEDDDRREIEHHTGLCLGFIKGVSNTLAVHELLNVCAPDGLENGDLIEVIMSRARLLSDDTLDLPSAAFVQLALEDAFPCTG